MIERRAEFGNEAGLGGGEFGIVRQLFRAGDALLPGGNQRDFNDPVRVQRGDQRLAQAVQRDAA